MREIFRRLRCRAKVNISFGLVLRHNTTGEFRYFHASHNNARFFNEPFAIGSEEDMIRLINELEEADLMEHGRRRRPDTKWIVHELTNITVYVNKINTFVIGAPQNQVPDYITNNRGLVTLVNNRHTGQPYNDKLCFFRCLAMKINGDPTSLERTTQRLLDQYRTETHNPNANWITMEDVSAAELVFQTNVQVYSPIPTENEGEYPDDDNVARNRVYSELVRRSARRYNETLYLNLHGDHFSYISDLKKYSKTYACSKCTWVTAKSSHLVRHEKTCEANVKHRFPGGGYQLPKTIFEKLAELGIVVDEQDRFYPYRATFDFECFFKRVPINLQRPGSKLNWESRHEILSCSVASNVPGHEEERCFVTDGDSGELVKRLVEYLHLISHDAHHILVEKYQDVFDELDRLSQQDGQPHQQETTHRPPKHPASQARLELDAFLMELPVLGFNSGKYDLNVIKRYLYPELQRTDPLQFIVKRTGTYMALKTDKLKFLDITNYLAPGYSYAKFLKAYEVEQQKGFFPYEWVDDLSKLDAAELPPHCAFYSKLKCTNISVEDYAYCQKVWKDKNMTTMKDFLIWYNNLDVAPFLDVVEKMFAFYQERCMDMFKCAISVPGLSLRYLFMTLYSDTGNYFSLIDETNKDLYYTIKDNIVGGPSGAFNHDITIGKCQK